MADRRVPDVVVGLLGLFSGIAMLAAGEPAETPGGGAILDASSYWRYHMVLRDPAYGTSAQDAKPNPPDKGSGHRFNTDAPPADWSAPEFDDTAWGLRPGPFFGGHGLQQPMSLAVLHLRGTFGVSDPSKAPELVFSAVYRGGIVAYLNGKEFVRKNMPEGPVSAETFAEIYPAEAYCTPDGKVIARAGAAEKERLDLRIRKAEDVAIPSSLMRKGANFLAIEIHRPPVHQSFLTLADNWKGRWGHTGLLSVQVKTKDGSAAVPNVSPNLLRPNGLQVWNADLVTPVFDVDYGDPNAPLRPIRIVGARNGTFSGQVVVSRDAPIKGLKATMSDLKPAGGEGTISSSAMLLRYAMPGGRAGGAGDRYPGARDVTSFDTLAEEPPAEVPVFTKAVDPRAGGRKPAFGAVQPVWVTVHIPGEAKAGEYGGELTIGVEGSEPVRVPVKLNVCDWKMPAARDFIMHTDFVESPESVALRYESPLWSEAHFKLVGQSLDLLGQVANKTIYIHLINRTNHGNSETMVRWIKQVDGSFTYDFSRMEKYLDLYVEKAGKPGFVIFYVSDAYTGQGYFGKSTSRVKKTGAAVSMVEAGKVVEFEGPSYDEQEAAKAFWKPVAEGIRERLKKRGLEDRWCIGLASDRKPSEATVLVWKEVAPEAKWVHQGHGLDGAYFGVPLGYNTTVWKPQWAADPDVKRTYGWKNPKRVAHFHRDIHMLNAITQLLESRLTGEKNIAGGQCGFGRMSADFWPVLKGAKGEMYSISSRYPETTWAQCNIRMTPYLAPGPQGALSTVRFEMVREGVEECEARIFIEKALLDKGQCAKLGEDLAKRAQALVDRRTRALICAGDDMGREWYGTSGWQDLAEKLYTAAGAVAKALGAGR